MMARITILPGDGVGPEVTAEARRVLEVVAHRFGHTFDITEHLIGGVAIDATGTALPADTIAACRAADAVLLGAVGGPRWDDPGASVRPEQGLLGIRRELGLYANLRPITIHPRLSAASPIKPERLRNVDILVVRELTGGIYFGEKRREPAGEWGVRAIDVCAYTTHEIERIVRMAGNLARARSGRLTSVDKANVLETSRHWREVTTRIVRDEFSELTLDHMLVDACAMHLVQNPARFDVIVTENMFGDILTDEASVLAGSIGAEEGGSRRGLYEPIHGSAPDIAGRGIANPLGCILSVALLLRYSLQLHAEAAAVESAATAVIDAGVLTRDVGGSATTVQTGDAIRAALAESRSPLARAD
jgi:3-isopropylmalate dehydrogenase